MAVLGASGYTGEEVVRLMALHPNLSVAALTGESQAGKVTSDPSAAILSAKSLISTCTRTIIVLLPCRTFSDVCLRAIIVLLPCRSSPRCSRTW